MKKNQRKVSLEFGSLIKQRREELGYSIQRIAPEVHSSAGYISRLENHKRRNPSICIVYALAEVLEIDIGYLVNVAFPKQ